MYDHLYSLFDTDEVDVVVHADHPTLNREVANRLSAGERIDVLSTHSKYAPSQGEWLRPLDALADRAAVDALAPRAVDLCRVDGQLLSLPRLIDVRVLWVRGDRLPSAPDTWQDLIEAGTPFGFPGRESGLFGTFFELVVGAGGRLFDADGHPTMATAEAEAAVEVLCALAAASPDDLPTWHYDEVDAALLAGRVDAAGAWPGAWGAIRSSELADVLEPHPYPAGPVRRVSYAGCHSWAIPRTCGDVDGALSMVHRLVGADAQALDASGGTLCAHVAALAAVEPDGDADRRRRDITRRTIDEAMITYPSLARFPEIEDAGWSAVNAALRGEVTAAEAVARVQSVAQHVLG
jgi:multiple sugar transport system substrate-binding protein